MRYLTQEEVIELHLRIIKQTGGASGILDFGAFQSALAQPQMTFAGVDLYHTIGQKAASLGFSLIKNHPFLDGNKRIGHAAMEVFLVLNGYELDAHIDEQENIILRLAAGEISREDFTDWIECHLVAANEFIV